MQKKGKCSTCNFDWFVCDNCRAAGCGNKKCGNYQFNDVYLAFGLSKCRTCKTKQ
jgi:hypothetical protein